MLCINFKKNNKKKQLSSLRIINKKYFSEIAQEDQKYLYISERHNSWMEKLRYSDDLEGPFFITVGVAHLPGERGLVKLLEGEGYELVPQKLHSKDKKEQSLIMDQ
ncbi:TraB/GumN family protein [Candidatus Babeliales bacterium]|nr:TraB/GumN family protein [Candidatus Babeliales bacterium]